MSDPDDEPLSHGERVNRFHGALVKLVDYYVDEYEITLAELIGTLHTEMFNRQSAAWHDAQVDDTEEDGALEE